MKKIFLITSAMLICILCITCRKKQSVSYPYNYTEKMGGTRNWVGTDSFGFTPLSGNDVTLTFAIAPINGTTINAKGDTLQYVSHSEPEQSMFFNKKTSQDSVAIAYYFQSDSIVYYKYERASLCCYSVQHLHAKK